MRLACVVVTLGTFLLGAGAVAQGTNPYDGTWHAEFMSEQGAPREGTVTIRGEGGSWDMLTRARNNPCVGRAAPIRVKSATADELVFEIARSQALAGCTDGLATLKPAGDRTLVGEFDQGRKLKLTRK